MTPRTVPIVCAKAPRHIAYVPAVREPVTFSVNTFYVQHFDSWRWYCSFCGARVKVAWW